MKRISQINVLSKLRKWKNKAFGDCILDGELMLFKDDEALHRADTITHVFKKKLDGGKLRLHVFDVMRHEGRDLVDEPLRENKHPTVPVFTTLLRGTSIPV